MKETAKDRVHDNVWNKRHVQAEKFHLVKGGAIIQPMLVAISETEFLGAVSELLQKFPLRFYSWARTTYFQLCQNTQRICSGAWMEHFGRSSLWIQLEMKGFTPYWKARSSKGDVNTTNENYSCMYANSVVCDGVLCLHHLETNMMLSWQ